MSSQFCSESKEQGRQQPPEAAVETKYFGRMSYSAESVFHFPAGLPGFEHDKFFFPIDPPAVRPLIFLQCLTRPELCFVTLPVQLADPNYSLDVSEEDREIIGMLGPQTLIPGSNVVCLVIANLRHQESGGPSAAVNLMAPIVVNPSCGLAVQAVRRDARYPAQFPLPL